ncbi:MAG: thiamine-phosphate kinase [Candidatus Sericytochromatia bacterium]|nr:thiamine-phosphate kinase [Candidatus Sericytochromatia bacterium]
MAASARLKMYSEAELIARARRFPRFHRQLTLGIDDDAALLQAVEQTLVWSVDTLAEDTHFLRSMPPAEIGWKALAVNLSDLAAMNARPVAALLSLSLPPDLSTGWIKSFFEGLEAACQTYQVDLAGGDTVRQRDLINLSISVLGQSARPFTRQGARAGDLLVLSGTLGASAAGLWAYQQGLQHPELWQRHWHPVPRFDIAALLDKYCTRVAALDTSDGLLRSIQILCHQNQLGCQIQLADLPAAPELNALTVSVAQRQHWVLNGGEDFELLAAVPAASVPALLDAAAGDLSVIGCLSALPEMLLQDGDQSRELTALLSDFQHF